MIPESMQPILDEAVVIWHSGGWGMYALAANGMVMYTMGMFMLLKLWAKGILIIPDRAWRKYKDPRKRALGIAGRIIAEAMRCRSLAEVENYFDNLRTGEVEPFLRDLRIMKASVGAAPLLGLLGTVTGMLSTFDALATGGGGDKTMGMVAGGISEALVTTETGLVLALSGLLFQAILTRQHDHFGKAVAHLENICVQHFRAERAARDSLYREAA